MAPKKDKGKKDDKVGIFSEVERTFLEQQVAECNRKIARLRSAVNEYETRNEELQNALEKLDEDRSDIIAFLKKQLHIKIEEHNELKEKLDGLVEIRDKESILFRDTVSELLKNFTTMKHQLTSENKLLAGKINTLEEFRYIRDDLMNKFNIQEQKFEDQEMSYKRVIYDTEKKFVIGKDKLKKEMETRLLQLAQDFQDATEIRIAASTHRVIRENIAISNELDDILSTQQKISDQNENYKEDITAATIAKELAEEERDKAINKSVVQLKIIDQLTAAYEKLRKETGFFEKKKFDFKTLQAKLEKNTKENDNLTLQVRILEQNLHAKLCDQNKAISDISKITKERNKLRNMLHNAAFAIEAALKVDQWAYVDPKREAMDIQPLLNHLLEIVTPFREIQEAESLVTIASFSKIYNEGDLGFVPRPELKKKMSGQSAYSHFSNMQKQFSESYKEESRKSDTTTSLTSSSNSSVKTIPSMQNLPSISNKETIEARPSLESFITSKQSTTSEEHDSMAGDDGKTDIEKQLLASKLEIQKSILKDLAFSQMSVRKSSLCLIKKQIDSLSSRKSSMQFQGKSVTIVESVQDLRKLQSSVHDLTASEPSEQKDLDDISEDKISGEEIDEKTESLSELVKDEKIINTPPEQ